MIKSSVRFLLKFGGSKTSNRTKQHLQNLSMSQLASQPSGEMQVYHTATSSKPFGDRTSRNSGVVEARAHLDGLADCKLQLQVSEVETHDLEIGHESQVGTLRRVVEDDPSPAKSPGEDGDRSDEAGCGTDLPPSEEQAAPSRHLRLEEAGTHRVAEGVECQGSGEDGHTGDEGCAVQYPGRGAKG